MSGTSARVALAKWGRKCGERRLFRIADDNGNCRLNSDGGGTVIVALLRLSLSLFWPFIHSGLLLLCSTSVTNYALSLKYDTRTPYAAQFVNGEFAVWAGLVREILVS